MPEAAGVVFVELGVVISTDEPEAAWNAFRLCNFARSKGDGVRVFLVGRGVDFEKASRAKFDSQGEAQKLLSTGGKIMACGTCLKLRNREGSETCPLSGLKDLYELVRNCDKVVSF